MINSKNMINIQKAGKENMASNKQTRKMKNNHRMN